MRRMIVGLALGIVGCGASGGNPSGVSDSLMVDVLVDVHLADARASMTAEAEDSLRAEALGRHGLDTLEFRRLLDYYAEHAGEYLPLYDAALDRLHLIQRGGDAPSDTL